MRHIAIAVLFLFPFAAHGQGLTVTAASTHYGGSGPKTEINPGFIQTLPLSANLFGIDFHPSGGVLINSVDALSLAVGTEANRSFANGHIELSARADGDAVVFTVRDTGVGMSEEQAPYLFDRLNTVSQSTFCCESNARS